MFDTTKEDLKEILRRVDSGKLQLPDFQRDYVWADEDVRSLIASIASGFPVGALLTLETGGEVEFKPRFLQGVMEKDVQPDTLLLDGQQRITSLYQSLFSANAVRTRNAKGLEIDRYYYLDIKRALEGDRIEDVIIGVPKDRIVRENFGKVITLDLSTQEKEFEQDLFPLNLAFDSQDWFFDWRDYWKARDREVQDLVKPFVKTVLEVIDDYKMPIIKLDKRNSREAICLVFEKVNVGGKKLDAFELVTAIYAASTFDLRGDWNGKEGNIGRRKRMIGAEDQAKRDVLTQIASTDSLQACTLLHTRTLRLARVQEGKKDKELPQVSCRRDALLGLPLDAYKSFADSVEHGFVSAGVFLNEQNIVWHKDIPYPPQLVTLASVFAILGPDAQNAAVKKKLEQWFWCVTLGELYGTSTESRLARDVPELVDWVRGQGPQPRSIDEALFQRDRLRTMRTRLSAAYKGVHALLMRSGCRDFITAKPTDIMTFFNDQIDIHHIFPQDYCKKQNISPADFNSIINKTALWKHTNILIGGDAPSVYLQRIQEKHQIEPNDLDDILRSHLIEPQYLRANDFDGFFQARSKALANLVSGAMGKPVVDDQGSNEMEFAPHPGDLLDEEDLELAS